MTKVPVNARGLSRRRVLRAGGVCLALPFFESLGESLGGEAAGPAARRFVCVANPFGMLKEDFFPVGDEVHQIVAEWVGGVGACARTPTSTHAKNSINRFGPGLTSMTPF